MNDVTLTLLVLGGLNLILLLILIFRKSKPIKDEMLHGKLDFLQSQSHTQNQSIQNVINENQRSNRDEIRNTISDSMAKMVSSQQDSFKELVKSLDRNLASFNELQKEKFLQIDLTQKRLIESTEKRLEQIRETVDEKLQKTLNERLGQSFETVGKQLIAVQEGLGEMRSIATDVGGLKKVLSNVKLRGGIGEIQLAMLLEQILAPDQYEANVKTKIGSNDVVEFAIKLPGKEDHISQVWLPIDAKFPKDAYERLHLAYEEGTPDEIDLAQKVMENTVKKMAKDIRDKYLDPPNTTDFGIMFLPFEGIYAEVIRKPGLLDVLQKEYKIIVAGPTTLAAMLNSLQMGFRTLALQKRSSEVWSILGQVKKEFDNFGGLLEKAQKNIHTAGSTLDELVGKRTKAIQRTLKNVQNLPSADKKNLEIPLIDFMEETEEDENTN
jgi:DNA recombination protein RmuC